MYRICTLILVLVIVSLQTFSQNSITTTQPVGTMDTNAVCVGSVIGIPFTSSGTFSQGNYYEAQLSDSTGLFFNPTSLLLNLDNNTYYNPNIYSAVVPDVPDGCNYYIRIRSTLPLSNLTPFGPICIQHYDIKTNQGRNIHICLSPTTTAVDTPLTIHVHNYHNDQVYNTGNQFKVQLLDTTNFHVVGTTGALGQVTATHDTSLNLHIPPLTTLQSMGINPGNYYLRVIATNTLYSDSSLGSLIRLTIGAPADNPYSIFNQVYYYPTTNNYDTIRGPICPALALNTYTFVLLEPRPWNFNTNYEWYGNFAGDSTSGVDISFNINAPNFLFIVKVQEINFGCRGPISANDTIVVIGPPQVSISTPSIVCVHDTTQWSVPLIPTTSYHWISLLHGTFIDTLMDSVWLRYDTVGAYHLNISATNICGSANSSSTINVIAPPTLFIRDSLHNMTAYFFDTVSTTIGNTYLWRFGDGATGNVRNPVHTYSAMGNYTVTLIVTNTCGTDSAQLQVNSLGINEIANQNQISLFPNPNNGNFTLSYNLNNTVGTSKLILTDIAGRNIYSYGLAGNAGKENIRIPLNNGIYFWKITTGTDILGTEISGGKLVILGN